MANINASPEANLNSSYSFRNTPTRCVNGAYKQFFQNAVKINTSITATPKTNPRKSLFNPTAIANDDSISLKSVIMRQANNASKFKKKIDSSDSEANISDSDQSSAQEEKAKNKLISKMRGEIKRTPSSVKKTEGGVVKRRNTITAASLTPSLQRRVTLKTIDQSTLSIYERARIKLNVANIPDVLTSCREKQFSDIFCYLESNLRNKTGGCMYICGVPGTGKTLTTKSVIKCLKESVADKLVPDFKFIDVNAFQVTEPHQIYKLIYKELTDENVSAEHAVMLLEKKFELKSSEPIILLVDELDMLCTKKQDVLYNLFDWPYKKNSKWIVIAIANAMNLPEQVMMNKISSRLGLTRLIFQPYKHEELEEIVTLRLQELNVFDMDAIVFAARKVAAVSGDARRALEICRRATELAEKESKKEALTKKNTTLVSISHVDTAIKQMFSSAKITQLKHASLMEQYFMKSIVNLFQKSGIEETTLNKIFEEHTAICNFSSIKPLNRTQFLNVCCSLASSKLILLEPSKNIYLQRVRCNMNTDDIDYGINNSLNAKKD